MVVAFVLWKSKRSNFLLLSKESLPMNLRLIGGSNFIKLQQFANAFSPIILNLESDENKIFLSSAQPKKAPSRIF